MEKENKLLGYLVEERYRFLRHGSFLLGLLVMFYNLSFTQQFSDGYKFYYVFLVWTVFVLMFYINMYFLVPVYFFRSQYLLYIILLIILVIIMLTLTVFLIEDYLGPHKIKNDRIGYQQLQGLYDGVIISIPLIMLTTTLKLFQSWLLDRVRIFDLKNIALTMELNELKNQINPHFLFNMLNNVKALIRLNPDKAVDVVLKLSDFFTLSTI